MPEVRDGAVPGLVALSDYIVAVGQDRDGAAFAALFAYFAPRLKTYFVRYVTVDGMTADELVQETMLLVWRKAALFDPKRAAASTWVFSIARNLRVDSWRLERRRTAAGDGAAHPEADPAPGSEQLLVAAGRAMALQKALQVLPREQVHVVLLSYFEDRSHAEIASRLGLPLGTVKSRLRTALVRLRAAMDAAH
jgi:RNA polymerase sigma-70 factor (ECF subfamily)